MAKKLTRRSAKPLHEGANPSGASKFFLNFIYGYNGRRASIKVWTRFPFRDKISIMSRRKRWTTDQLKRFTRNSFSYRQVLIKLGLREAGGNYDQLKKYIKELNLDVSHFKGRGWNAGLQGIGKPIIPLEKILTTESYFQSYKLKNRLFSANLKPKHCENCKWARKTTDGYLPLELHHINGDRHDNRIENLEILCPNCHSLKSSYRGRRKSKK